MKKKLLRKMTLIAIVSFFSFRANAQDSGKNLKELINDERGRPSFIVFNTKSTYKSTESQKAFTEQLGLKANSKFTKIKSESDQLGFTHEKFQLYHQGLKVEYATYTLHSKSGKIASMSGEIYSLDKVNIKPVLTKEAAFTLALNQIGATEYLWESAANAKAMNYQKPSGELILFPVLENPNAKDNNLRLAYKFDIYATNPLSRGDLYIDAVTGAVLYYNATIKHLGAPSHGQQSVSSSTSKGSTNTAALAFANAATRYSGTQSIQTALSGSSYILSDVTRGLGVQTFNMKKGTNYTAAVDFTDADNNWTAVEFANANKDNGALDAHWGAEKTYDYWKTVHGRNSYDNAGSAIKSYVHYNLAYDNAYWNGSVMTYGDGSGTNLDIITSLDIVGHEIGHGVCDKTANLKYQKESGALNEAFSDIWGACIEYFAAPTKSTWLIAEDIDNRAGHLSMRSMNNPKAEGQPDTYGGINWFDTIDCYPSVFSDNCGVHTNSSILNHWFYILSVGKSGTNDIGSIYTLKGITIEKAAKIAYRLESVYLSANSTYANARTYGIQAAVDLYGAGSAEMIATTNAFYAVGVGAAYGPDSIAPSVPANLSASGITTTSTTLSWTPSTDNVAVAGYVLYNGTTFVCSIKGTSYTVSGLYANTAYTFTVKASDTAGNLSTLGTSVSVTTLDYCISKGISVADEYISSVKLGSINNTSSNGSGYSDFTAIKTNLTKGSSATIIVSPYWNSTSYKEGYAVWIDFNGDHDFDDADELVWSKEATTATPVAGSFIIPITAISGSTRMRVSMKYNGVPGICEIFSYGEVEDYTVKIVSDTEVPTAPASLVAFATTATTTTLSWAASTDNVGVTAYTIYNGTTLVATVIGTSFTVSGLTPSTAYTFIVKSKDTSGNLSLASNTTSVTTLKPYCVSIGYSSYEYISKVQIGAINTISGKGNGYSDFTAISTNLTKGSSATITVTPTWSSYSYKEGYAVWIDYNGDRDFDDAGELVWSKKASTTTPVTGSFTIPSTALSGTTTMRVSMKFNGVPSICEIFSYGEVEDYTVNLVSDTQVLTAPENLVATGTTATTTTLSWDPSIYNVGVTEYTIYNGTTLVATVPGTSYIVSGLTPSNAYTFSVKAKDSDGNLSLASNVISVTTSVPNVSYCSSKGAYIVYESISNVQLGNINNASSGGNGYSDFSAISTNLIRGNTVTIIVTPKKYSYDAEGYAVWIDYNGDSDFADAGELVCSIGASKNAAATGFFTIPSTASLGSTRMRVSMKYNGVPSACESFYYGEVEDYTVNIGGDSNTAFMTSFSGDLGVENKTNDFTLFPNPVSDLLNIGLSDNRPATFKIINYLGQEVEAGMLSENVVNVSKLAVGVYIIEVNDGQKMRVKKFIKN